MVSSSEYVICTKCVDEMRQELKKKNYKQKREWLQNDLKTNAHVEMWMTCGMTRLRARFPVLNQTMNMLSFKRAQHMRKNTNEMYPVFNFWLVHINHRKSKLTANMTAASTYLQPTYVRQCRGLCFLLHVDDYMCLNCQIEIFYRTIFSWPFQPEQRNEREHVIQKNNIGNTSKTCSKSVSWNRNTLLVVDHLPVPTNTWTCSYSAQPTAKTFAIVPAIWFSELSASVALRRVKCHIFVTHFSFLCQILLPHEQLPALFSSCHSRCCSLSFNNNQISSTALETFSYSSNTLWSSSNTKKVEIKKKEKRKPLTCHHVRFAHPNNWTTMWCEHMC